MKHCDKSGDHKLNKKEAIDCIKSFSPDTPRAAIKAHVDATWADVDTDGSGKVDVDELAAHLGQSLAQKKGGKGKGGPRGGDGDHPSPAEIMEECDTNEDGMMDADEAHVCIDNHITDPEENAMAHAMVDEGFKNHGPMSKEDIEGAMEEMEE
jgi:Ca2+-binding EF-hand superfamily protein